MLVRTLSTLSFSFIAVILFAQSTDAMKSGELEALFALCFCSKKIKKMFFAHIPHTFSMTFCFNLLNNHLSKLESLSRDRRE